GETGALVRGGGPPAPGGVAVPFGKTGTIGTEGGAICPRGTSRSTMFTPLWPSGPVSFSAACSRRTSIASRMVASRNSMCGMMILFSLLVIAAVPPNSRWLPTAAGAPAAPYFLTGCCHASSTFHSWRDRVSLNASSPYWYLVLLTFSWPFRAAVLYGSRHNT